MEEEKSSFYDRLGDLLSETLEAGHVNFIRLEREYDAGEGEENFSSTNGSASSAGEATSSTKDATSSTAHATSFINRATSFEKESVSSARNATPFTKNATSSIKGATSSTKGSTSSTVHATSSTNRATSFEKESASSTRSSTSTSSTRKRVIYKHITPEISKAFRLLDITPSANLEDLKKAYKEKIKYYHPDKFQNNPVMEKVATDKTRQVVEAYALLVDFISN